MTDLRAGIETQVTVRELPQRTFRAKIVRTSEALDPQSRTLIAEVQLPNPGSVLRPGMFAQVAFQVPQASGMLLIPDGALITNAGGTQVAVVTKESKIHFQPITVGRDFGQTIQVISGLKPTDQVADTPTDNLQEGMKVKATQAKKGQGGAGGQGQQGGSGKQAGGKKGPSGSTNADPENLYGGNGSSSLPLSQSDPGH